jgi:cohesin complex subunit SCC1
MFYSQIILAKKGPLAKVWLAAHWGDKKLGRPQIFATDISASVDCIVHPQAPLALRVSGHLLLGVVRIYSRKVKYLMNDAHEAMIKIKMAFSTQHDGAIDLKQSENNLNAANFGEYQEVVFEPVLDAHGGFQIPVDLDETAAEDWEPAELDEADMLEDEEEDQDDNARRGTIAGDSVNADLTLNTDLSSVLNRREEEEEWTAFDPDDDMPPQDDEDVPPQAEDDEDNMLPFEDDDNVPPPPADDEMSTANQTAGESSMVSDIEVPRAADDSMMSDQQVRKMAVIDPL